MAREPPLRASPASLDHDQSTLQLRQVIQREISREPQEGRRVSGRELHLPQGRAGGHQRGRHRQAGQEGSRANERNHSVFGFFVNQTICSNTISGRNFLVVVVVVVIVVVVIVVIVVVVIVLITRLTNNCRSIDTKSNLVFWNRQGNKLEPWQTANILQL